MKKCIVLSGQYRTFDKTWQSIKSFIDTNDLDVYCHLWSTDKNEIDNVIQRLDPKNIIVNDNTYFYPMFAAIEQSIIRANPKNMNGDSLSKQASMNYSRKIVFDSLPENTYDTIVHCRYDIAIKQNFKFDNVQTIISPQAQAYGFISDIFGIIPSSMANSYFLFDEFRRLHSTPFEPEILEWIRKNKHINLNSEEDIIVNTQKRYCPHLLLARNILLNRHSFTLVNLELDIQR